MTALYLVESTMAVMQLSEKVDEPLKAFGMGREDFIQHSLMLMRNSLGNDNKRGD